MNWWCARPVTLAIIACASAALGAALAPGRDKVTTRATPTAASFALPGSGAAPLWRTMP